MEGCKAMATMGAQQVQNRAKEMKWFFLKMHIVRNLYKMLM